MPRFFVTAESINDGYVVISGDDARHVSRSLRMRVGDPLVLCDGEGLDYDCVIAAISSDRVTVKIHDSFFNSSEPTYRATVFQALARGDKPDVVVQKSVEYGAVRIVPFSSERCNVKLSSSDGMKKTARWQRIAEEAAKQSGRGTIPQVMAPMSFAEMLHMAGSCDISLFCWEHSAVPLRDVIGSKSADTIAVVIGPEGGFSDEEANMAEEAGLTLVSLGRRILRTESAAPFVLACVSYEMER